MEPNAFPQLQLWCPRPFGTYSQNKPCPGPSPTKKPFCRPAEAPPGPGGGTLSENTPPTPTTHAAPAPTAAAAAAAAVPEEGRVLLDTWYVIKPGNTKEKVAFFVAHQCGAGYGAARASTMKVKGNWGSDSSKAKRRRRCHDPAKSRARGGGGGGVAAPVSPHPNDPPGIGATDTPDLLSVAEMVALVEQRTALALQSFPACGGTGSAAAAPVVFVDAGNGGGGGDTKAPSGSDCSRVAEAVAHFESRQRGGGTGGARHNGLCRPNAECSTTTTAATPPPPPSSSPSPASPSPGEVRIAFRISSGRDAGAAGEAGATGRPNCVFMSCGAAAGTAGGTAKDKITCDLYQLISPSRDALPNNVEFLLAAAAAATATPSPKGDGGDGAAADPPPPRDCPSGFHVDVVVTGVVDQCVFFGKDSAKKMKEETITLPIPPPQEDPPPPGQLFFLPIPEETPGGNAADRCRGAAAAGSGGGGDDDDDEAAHPPPGGGAGGGAGGPGDPSLCRLYRHVSHDFLEIRFKIQRLLEPRQYMLLLPEHVMVKIFSYLPTQALAALKCSCTHFKSIIETFGVRAADSRWNRHPSYRDDPCKQCRKRYEKGDVSLCRWHPKPYHHDLPYGRSYWMCCRRGDKEAPGCRVGVHDNNWVSAAAAAAAAAAAEAASA
ncbi:FBX46 protein, partial [Atlantisia rogersi]|nr:FBX46 protein [Atlantisia rogersi]